MTPTATPDHTDAVKGSYGIFRFINPSRSSSPDPKRKALLLALHNLQNFQGQVTHPATQEQSRFSTFINSRDQASPCEELDRAAANGIWEAKILARYQRRMGETANAIGWLVGSLGFHSSRGLGRPIPWGGSLDVAP